MYILNLLIALPALKRVVIRDTPKCHSLKWFQRLLDAQVVVLPSQTRQYALELRRVISVNLWFLVHEDNSLVLSIDLQILWHHDLLQVLVKKCVHYLFLKTGDLVQLINDKQIELLQVHIPYFIEK